MPWQSCETKESALLVFRLVSHGAGAAVTAPPWSLSCVKYIKTSPVGFCCLLARLGGASRAMGLVLFQSHRSRMRTLLRRMCVILASSTEGLQQQPGVSRKINMQDEAFQGEGACDSVCAVWPGTS